MVAQAGLLLLVARVQAAFFIGCAGAGSVFGSADIRYY